MRSSTWSTEFASVRVDLAAALDAEWDRLGHPGTWWTGEERIALAREARTARSCRLCRTRRAALSPYAAPDNHSAAASLPGVVVDGVHRLASDPGRIARRWSDEILAAGITQAQIVELIGVAATQTMVDTFCRGIGRPPLALPPPVLGEPCRQLPPQATVSSARLPTVEPENADGELADYYAKSSSGRVPTS
jgi:hypothetical protein